MVGMECYGNGSCLSFGGDDPSSKGSQCSNGSPCSKGCKLMPCANTHCKEKRPEWVLHCNDGLCVMCASSIGKVTFLDEKADCPICLDSKEMIQIECGGKHKVCMDCWLKWSDTNDFVTCMICRRVCRSCK